MQEIKKNLFACSTSYLIAFAVSLLFLIYGMKATTVDNLDVDESFYYQQAVKLAEGKYKINPYRPIGFPMILASILVMTGGHLFKTKAVLILISSLRAPLLYLFAREITGNYVVSFISSLVIAIWPTFVYLSATLYTESISPAYFLALMIVLPRLSTGWLPWITAGVLLAILILLHPMYCLFIPFLFLIQFFEGTLRKFLVVMAAYLIVIFPWSYSISKSEGEVLIASRNLADALAGGLNEKLLSEKARIIYAPNGRMTWIGPGLWIPDNGYLTPEEENLNLKERNKLLYEKLWQWVKVHPYDTFYLEVMKLLSIWGFYPFLSVLKVRILFGNIPILVLLFLSILALWKWRKNYRELCRLWVLPIFVSAVALLAVGSWRYRLPGDLALIILSTMYIYSWFSSKPLIKSIAWK